MSSIQKSLGLGLSVWVAIFLFAGPSSMGRQPDLAEDNVQAARVTREVVVCAVKALCHAALSGLQIKTGAFTINEMVPAIVDTVLLELSTGTRDAHSVDAILAVATDSVRRTVQQKIAESLAIPQDRIAAQARVDSVFEKILLVKFAAECAPVILNAAYVLGKNTLKAYDEWVEVYRRQEETRRRAERIAPPHYSAPGIRNPNWCDGNQIYQAGLQGRYCATSIHAGRKENCSTCCHSINIASGFLKRHPSCRSIPANTYLIRNLYDTCAGRCNLIKN